MSTNAQANPVGGVAVHGQVNLVSTGNTLKVTTQNGAGTSHSAINWQSFSIPAGSSSYFQQPSAVSTVINRVVTNTPSIIFGSLSSNGKLVLVNHAGITVGTGAVVDTAAFTASALRMTDADAIAGRLRFGDKSSSGAGISVQGSILARSGDVMLVASNIDTGKDALIQAPNGNNILAAGRQIEITGRGLEGIFFQVQAPTDNVLNLGTLKGNAVAIFAGTLKHSGDIQANSVSMDGGKIVLKAVGDALIEGGGKLTAKGIAAGAMGGTVDLLGGRVAFKDQAVIDVSGDVGGGTVRLGGDLQGQNADIQNAVFTYTGAQTSIKADALTSGNGGKVIVWADDTTRAYGSISAKGGVQSGDGGFVETSGKRGLDIAGARIDTSAGMGANGQWLLDPSNVTIVHGSASSFTGGIFDPAGSLSIGDTEINAALVNNNVTIQTSNGTGGTGAIVVNGSADVNGPVDIRSSSGGLYLKTIGNVNVRPGANITVPYVFVEGGDITVNGNITTDTLDLASRGYLNGTGALVTNRLFTQSVTGTLLNGTANQVLGSWNGYNTGAGNIELASSGGFQGIFVGAISNTNGGVTVNSTNGITVAGNINVAGAVALAAGAGDLTQTSGSGSISNVSAGTTGTPGMLLSGANITLRSVQSAGGVQLTSPGNVNLLGLGSGGFIDDTFFSYNLPFTFNYFGTDYNQAFITTNGLITFGSSTPAYSDSTEGLKYLRAISPAWNDWILQADEGKDIRIASSASSLGVRWNVGRYADTTKTAQFESILNPNGVIRFNYGAANQTFAGDVTIGISNGNGPSGIHFFPALTSDPAFSMNNLRSITYAPDGQGSYTETLSAGSTPLSVFGAISGSAILGQGSGEVINAVNALNISAGGEINAPSRLTAQSLQFQSRGGAQFTGDNNFGAIGASTNTGLASDILIYNTASTAGSTLVLGDLSNSAGGITVSTPGGIDLTGRFDALGAVALTTQTGAITQTGASNGIFAPSLITSSFSGTTLAYSGNQIGGFTANNASSGHVELTTAGSLVVGSITNPLGQVLITNTNGDITAGAIGASSITLSALAGSIRQVAGFSTAGVLTASSRDGIVLDQADNQVGNFRANTTGTGNVHLRNASAVNIQDINVFNGYIDVINTGGVRTSGLVTAPYGNIAMTANSPLTIGTAGISAGGNIILTATNLTSLGDITLNGPVTSIGRSIMMTAANTFTQNSAVSAHMGVTAIAGAGFTFGPAATTAGNPVSYSSGTAPPTPLPKPPSTPVNTQAATTPTVSSSPTDFVVAFLSHFEDALREQNADTGADKTTKKTKDGVVTGAQTCSR